MRFTKIKVKKNKVQLEYEKLSQNGTDYNKYTMDCAEDPEPALSNCLQDLASDVTDICEMPEHYTTRITVSSVSFSYGGEKGVMGAVITAQMMLMHRNAPLNINTPHLIEEYYAETGDPKQLLPDDTIDKLNKLQKYANRYVNGIRAQMDMFNAAKDFRDSMQETVDKHKLDSISISVNGGEEVVVAQKKGLN